MWLTSFLWLGNRRDQSSLAATVLQKHFGEVPKSDLLTASRKFPPTARADLQRALEESFAKFGARPLGLHQQFSHSGITFADLLETGHNAVSIGPLQHDEIDTGEDRAERCVKTALWLSASEGVKFAVLVANSDRYSQPETIVEVAVQAGETGSEFSRQFLQDIEKLVSRSLTYRGKVISLEQSSRYSGESGSIRVHKLHSVTREQVILPQKTLQLLERNVMDFIAQRDDLQKLGMASKKGLLFYGPPGTGKTHTIHYLASQLPEHTTLLITAGQVGLLEEYFLLARFMQPAMIVIEDADLIARDRETMDNPCAESLLNKLLNEMDGLRSDAAILFVLTTNRAEHLEQALASRPGRVDQAIEFPLPDEEGRLKLLKLYAGELKLGDQVTTSIVKRTEGASAAFIKELMRRVAQYHLQNGNQDGFAEDVNLALEDMLFTGGKLNLKLLGGSMAAAPEEAS